MPDPAGVSSGEADTVYFLSGTQAPNPRDNYVSVTKVQNIRRFKHKEEKSDETSSEDSEDEVNRTFNFSHFCVRLAKCVQSSSASSSEESAKEVFFQQRLRHLGGINRLRCLPQDPRVAAVWSDKGLVEVRPIPSRIRDPRERPCGQIYDVTAALNRVQDNQSTADSAPSDALFAHKHESEGFALDWSRVKKGLLASGKRCRSRWTPYMTQKDRRLRTWLQRLATERKRPMDGPAMHRRSYSVR